MTILLSKNPAPGGPGIAPRWARSDKDGVGTAYSAVSRIWFTLSRGVINEVYYPTIDRPQLRDLQFLITDGESFFHDERRYLQSKQEYIAPLSLGFRIVNRDPKGRYQITKEIISDPHQACLLIHAKLEGDADLLAKLKLYALAAPHLEVGGWNNNGNVAETFLGKILTANKGLTWLALGATLPFRRCSCGFVGVNDGWQDLSDNYQMDFEYDSAVDGNIALTGEFDLSKGHEFVLGLAFGDSMHQALVTLAQGLNTPFPEHRERFIEQWNRAASHCEQFIERRKKTTGLITPTGGKPVGDDGHLYRKSHSLILAHEDKLYDGAMIASLSIPWGEAIGDDDVGGYHLVWTRDMCNSAGGLLATGDASTPLRALIYLACTQRPDGGFYQNFWINGQPYWKGIQLDEVAVPIVLAWRLHRAKALKDFDPLPMVLKAAAYLIHEGPVTAEERWEENSGYSPSTLAAGIAGLICAAAFVRERGHEDDAVFLEDYADFLESHVEPWTVTTQGSLVPGIPRHYVRINPIPVGDPHADEDVNHNILDIRNRPPGAPWQFPAKDVVDAGFLELVRYGIRKGGDPLIEDSLKVVDAVLKVDTPFGPCWHRYNHDGFGQAPDGGPYLHWGRGRAWPLLTGERGHYDLAAGRDPFLYIQTMERFASATALLPEQVWDEPDRPDAFMYFGLPTGGAMPLMWAHAEYLRLVRSAADGQVFDLIPEVANRYLRQRGRKDLEIWKFNRQVARVAPGKTLRVQVMAPFRLHWTMDEWQTRHDTASTNTLIGKEYVDLPVPPGQKAPIRFTFFWTSADNWEGKDFEVEVV